MQPIVDWLVSLNIPFVTEPVARFILNLILASLIAVVAPASLLLLTWLERKIIARIQDRVGPNRAGPFGLLQAVADMIKMFTKEDITPARADRVPYNIAPGLVVFSAIMLFAVIPFAPLIVGANLNVGVIYLIGVGGIGTLAILIAGWSSNNKYALLGGFRVVAMMLTYEIPMVLALTSVVLVAGSMSLQEIVFAQSSMWYFLTLPVAFLIFFFSGLAETGRSPFDLVEAESEIIAGFHTEYSGIKFGLFMIGEYVHMFALAFLTAVLFFGGWQVPFVDVGPAGPLGPVVGSIVGFISLMIKVFIFVFIMMWFRGTLPRFRIDHLQDLGWKFLVPVSIFLLIVVAIIVRLFAPGSTAGIPVEPGPLSGLGVAGEIVALLLVNLLVAVVTLLVVTRAARRSRNRGLRAVTAVEGVPAK
jgi:NADH-quinone oxidoreductase subunit H